MTGVARRLRGALGVATTWSFLWMAIGVAAWGVIRVLQPGDIGPGEGLDVALPILGVAGFLSGLGFASLLALAERRRGLRDLSLWRVALWGFLGAAAIPLLLGADMGEGWITGTLGAVFAAGWVAIARRGARASAPLPDELASPRDPVA